MFLQVFASLLLSAGVDAAIGPVADLVIANQYISPDGFNRSYVLQANLVNNTCKLNMHAVLF